MAYTANCIYGPLWSPEFLSFLSSPRHLDVLIIHIWFTIYSLVLPRLPGLQVRPYLFCSILHTRVGLVKPVSLSPLSILRRPLDLFTSSHVSRLRTPRHHRSLVPRPTSYTSTIPQDHARYTRPSCACPCSLPLPFLTRQAPLPPRDSAHNIQSHPATT